MRLEEPGASNIRWAVPKVHYEGHGENHEHLCLNYLPHVGRSYGEGIESSWAHMNLVSTSTKEMAPSVRREALDDHWNAWNWQKTRRFGKDTTYKQHIKIINRPQAQRSRKLYMKL